MSDKDWEEFDSLSDKDIASAIKEDMDSAWFRKDFWKDAEIIDVDDAEEVQIKIDSEDLRWLKDSGIDYKIVARALLHKFVENRKGE